MSLSFCTCSMTLLQAWNVVSVPHQGNQPKFHLACLAAEQKPGLTHNSTCSGAVESPNFEAPLRGPFPGPPPPTSSPGREGRTGRGQWDGCEVALSSAERGIYQLPACTYLLAYLFHNKKIDHLSHALQTRPMARCEINGHDPSCVFHSASWVTVHGKLRFYVALVISCKPPSLFRCRHLGSPSP